MSDIAVNVVRSRPPRHAVATVTALVVTVALSGCEQRNDRTPALPGETTPVVAPERPAVLPAPDPVLDRAALLLAIDAAASDAAAGAIPPTLTDPLAGRRFRMRIAFGCMGPEPVPTHGGPETGAPAWSSSADGKTIRLRFSPADWTGGGPAGPAVEGFENVAGVLINQPWMRTEGCPAPGAPDPQALAAPGEDSVGLAVLRAEGASRLGRGDDRALAFSVRGEGDASAPAPTRGYRLLLEGRLTPWANGRVIRCSIKGADRRPFCAAGVVLDRLAYEDGATGATLSEWRPG